MSNAKKRVAGILKEDERILWFGTPHNYNKNAVDNYGIIHGVIFCLMIAFLFLLVLFKTRGTGRIIGCCWIAFILLGGVYYVFRIASRVYKRNDTLIYSITNMRVISITVDDDNSNVTSFPLKYALEDNMSINEDGTGTIEFSNGLKYVDTENKSIVFYSVKNADKVLSVFREAKGILS